MGSNWSLKRFLIIFFSVGCKLNDLDLPEHGVDWLCDGPVVNGTVAKRIKCELICRDGYTMKKGYA